MLTILAEHPRQAHPGAGVVGGPGHAVSRQLLRAFDVAAGAGLVGLGAGGLERARPHEGRAEGEDGGDVVKACA